MQKLHTFPKYKILELLPALSPCMLQLQDFQRRDLLKCGWVSDVSEPHQEKGQELSWRGYYVEMMSKSPL